MPQIMLVMVSIDLMEQITATLMLVLRVIIAHGIL